MGRLRFGWVRLFEYLGKLRPSQRLTWLGEGEGEGEGWGWGQDEGQDEG